MVTMLSRGTIAESRSGARFMLCAVALAGLAVTAKGSAQEKHFLYVAAPGIRDHLEFGGAGILIFDVGEHHRFLRRIETPASQKNKPENIKGICANAANRKLYFTTLTKLYCLDLISEKTLWEKTLPGGCDRMSITPDGKLLYVPSLEGPHWNVVDGKTGDVITRIDTKSGAHNTVCSLDGSLVFLAGLRSPFLSVLETSNQRVIRTVGPFGASIRPFAVNAAKTLVFVNVNDLLGFEIGDLTTGRMLYRVEVKDAKRGPPKRHGCPSHGIGLTPDEKEIWLCDAANSLLHIFDVTALPPRQIASIKLREQPGWITFGLDGRFAYPSTGQVIDAKSRQIVTALQDEKGREVHSEKMLEMIFKDGAPLVSGDQFGIGRHSPPRQFPH
jgi:DNA-binding beta-propeller fold protein YncE